MTLAALRLPAGKAIPILSSLSLRFLPPSLDLALIMKKNQAKSCGFVLINPKFIWKKDFLPDKAKNRGHYESILIALIVARSPYNYLRLLPPPHQFDPHPKVRFTSSNVPIDT